MTLIFGRNWQSWAAYLTCCFVTDWIFDVTSILGGFAVAVFWVVVVPRKFTFTTKEK